MSKYEKVNNSKYSHSNILGIQFSILSPDEIRNASVAEITNRDTYENNKPKIGGLFDPRMGVLEPGLICPTDGLNYIQTPGYFGHIELAKPVFYIQYLSTIMKILRCVCYKCSKLKISKEKYKHYLKLKSESRWNSVFQIASKVFRCGEETEDGCGCKQPSKIKKEGLANLFAEWDGSVSENDEKINMKITPEIVLKIFKRISDDDITFMGFSPSWSRPEWMVCQVLAICPPAVRPSVKHDAQQRSEDDITHIIVNIIKTNKILQERIEQNSAQHIIEDWALMLQYYVATQVDNKIPGVHSVAQRSGRPLKSVKERLNGKQGRVRGNLMGKRVDYSARSVITADPSISIRELGVPLKIAKNITKPVTVNDYNKDYLMKLISNGAEKWPGAKTLVKKSGETITLRYADINTIHLQNGDVVHRHMLDGDAVLFNRQPTLHRMSMMCHIAKIMKVGDTFRMNVADTKPYNADFDGDEMNLHMPQDVESEAELLNLAHVPYQIISPANNSSLIGIFQDSLLGSFRFTRENITFTPRQAMNLLMKHKNIDTSVFQKKNNITNFEILSQIMPPLTLKYKTELFNDGDNYNKSNNVLEIENGVIRRGQIEKKVFGSGTKGLLQRICNDFGNIACSNFIDNIQNIVTEYMKTSGYSVGISDLISNEETKQKINEVIYDKKKSVKNILDEIQLGVFQNDSGKPNVEEFETQVNNILNQATSQAGKIGLNSLNKTNRFVSMVNAGSKGSELNIAQMTSCLGQQNVNGKRISYGFSDRTLPHFSKYDDSPSARGFVENSYIGGLLPEELFFHAMGGRTGLIDTAVKTSQSGYIQRRLIKGMEDLKVEYDMTVRNSKGKIVQYQYGDDGVDTIRVETQKLPFVNMSLEEIYAYYYIPRDNDNIFTVDTKKRLSGQSSNLIEKTKSYIDNTIMYRDEIVDKIFNYKDDSTIHLPVSFNNIINNIQKQFNLTSDSLVDITPMETYQMIETNYATLQNLQYCAPSKLFEILYYYYLNPRELLFVKRINKTALSYMLNYINMMYKKSIIAPGEMVGMIAAQSIGEPTTQLTLNTFHFAGVASKSTVTKGVPRIEELLSLSDNPKNPSCTVYLNKDENMDKKSKAKLLMYMIENTKLKDLVNSVQIYFDPDDGNTQIADDVEMMEQYYEFENMVDECSGDNTNVDNREKSKWLLRMEMNDENMFEKNITMDDINFALKNSYGDDVHCVYNDYNSKKLVFRIRMNNVIKKNKNNTSGVPQPLDQSDEIYLLKNFQETLLNNIDLRGVSNIKKVIMRKILDEVIKNEDKYVKEENWVLDTVGSNLIDLLALDFIDYTKTTSTHITEVYNVLGIEAARQTIYNEIVEVMENSYINYHHLTMLCDRMTYSTKMISIFRHGINGDDIGPLAKASFEETPEMFLKAARHGELDHMRGISANVMCGQEGNFGTSSFQVILDLDKMKKLEEEEYIPENKTEYIENMFKNIDKQKTKCNDKTLKIDSNINTNNITESVDDDYMPDL